MGAKRPLTGNEGKRLADVGGIHFDNRRRSALIAGHQTDLDPRLHGHVEDGA
jgi:hypothetical protein